MIFLHSDPKVRLLIIAWTPIERKVFGLNARRTQTIL